MPASFDQTFVLGVQQVMLAVPWGVGLSIFFARWLILFEICIPIAFIFSKHRLSQHAAVEAAWGVGVALVLTSLLSRVMQRARPFLDDPNIALLIPAPLNTSFPSGHTATAVAIACAIFYVNRTAGLVAFTLAAFIAFGRIAAGVHHPTDILGGALVGVLSFALVRLAHGAVLKA